MHKRKGRCSASGYQDADPQRCPAVKEICGKTSTKPLILTTFDDDEFVTGAIKNGARGYPLKNNPPDKIKDAIRMVYSGNTVMQDIILDKLKEGLTSNKGGKADQDR